MKWKIELFFTIAIFFFHGAVGQGMDTIVAPINKQKIAWVSGISATLYTGSLIGLNELWYKSNPRQSFAFFNDLKEWKQVDKIGHFYSSFYFSHATSTFLKNNHVPIKKADWAGALTGFLIMAPIEIFDGYSAAYGASAWDLLANASGPLIFLGQQAAWNEIRLIPKFSFHRTPFAPLNPGLLGDGRSSEWLKDYNGQTYWLSIDMDKFIRFPPWLNIAVGYGAENMVNANDMSNRLQGFNPYRQYYLAFDIDMKAIPTRSPLVRSILFVLQMIKLPAPALSFSRYGVKAKPFYY